MLWDKKEPISLYQQVGDFYDDLLLIDSEVLNGSSLKKFHRACKTKDFSPFLELSIRSICPFCGHTYYFLKPKYGFRTFLIDFIRRWEIGVMPFFLPTHALDGQPFFPGLNIELPENSSGFPFDTLLKKPVQDLSRNEHPFLRFFRQANAKFCDHAFMNPFHVDSTLHFEKIPLPKDKTGFSHIECKNIERANYRIGEHTLYRDLSEPEYAMIQVRPQLTGPERPWIPFWYFDHACKLSIVHQEHSLTRWDGFEFVADVLLNSAMSFAQHPCTTQELYDYLEHDFWSEYVNHLVTVLPYGDCRNPWTLGANSKSVIRGEINYLLEYHNPDSYSLRHANDKDNPWFDLSNWEEAGRLLWIEDGKLTQEKTKRFEYSRARTWPFFADFHDLESQFPDIKNIPRIHTKNFLQFIPIKGGVFTHEMVKPPSDIIHPFEALIPDYSIAKYPVSCGLWREVMGNSLPFTGSEYPQEHVAWLDAVRFCNKLSEREGIEKAYQINGDQVSCDFSKSGYRLPSFWEWWYAAMKREGNVYSPYVDDILKDKTWNGMRSWPFESAWVLDNSFGRARPLGLLRPTQSGIHDLCGSVHEWAWDIAVFDQIGQFVHSNPLKYQKSIPKKFLPYLNLCNDEVYRKVMTQKLHREAFFSESRDRQYRDDVMNLEYDHGILGKRDDFRLAFGGNYVSDGRDGTFSTTGLRMTAPLFMNKMFEKGEPGSPKSDNRYFHTHGNKEFQNGVGHLITGDGVYGGFGFRLVRTGHWGEIVTPEEIQNYPRAWFNPESTGPAF